MARLLDLPLAGIRRGMRALLVVIFAGALWAQTYAENLSIDHPAIHYSQGPLHDPVARLQKQLESGETKLDFVEELGYLPSLLEHLGVNADSQALVFSKTSFQSESISPRNPRAIYFGDDVAVGFVRGGAVLEMAALDPVQGVVFYTLGTGKASQPHIARREECLKCHQGPATLGVPGIFVGSVYPGPTGLPNRAGAIITDDTTPFADRWGGWYVNALRGEQKDRANSVAPDPEEPEMLETEGRQNLPSLFKEFPSHGYLSAVSDIVALMTFEHQTKMTNLITRLGWEARMGKDPARGIEAVADYMVFTGEAPLKEPIEGVSTFTETFPRRGPKDRQGRSLRDFDLQTRLFRYPLSYMIYSEAFNALPGAIRSRVYERIYEKLPDSGRRAVTEILRDTKPDAVP